tara:strand:- start:462 stop:575 length:114 start_codon:yes stop_codon:yes gene_type:complete
MTKLNDTPAEYEDYLVYKYEQIACGYEYISYTEWLGE